VAIYELRKTRGAAEVTASAAKRTQLLTLIQVMRSIERDLDGSLPNRRTFAIRALNDWRSSATELHALLSKAGNAPQQLLDDLQASRELAALAKNDLQLPARPTVTDATRKVRETIAAVCDDAAQFIATID
jgi:hypothetical protein